MRRQITFLIVYLGKKMPKSFHLLLTFLYTLNLSTVASGFVILSSKLLFRLKIYICRLKLARAVATMLENYCTREKFFNFPVTSAFASAKKFPRQLRRQTRNLSKDFWVKIVEFRWLRIASSQSSVVVVAIPFYVKNARCAIRIYNKVLKRSLIVKFI